MAHRVIIRPRAEADVTDAIEYYGNISPALAGDFVGEFEAAWRQLARHPEIGSKRFAHFSADRSLRVWSLDRFPFGVFDRLEGEEVHILRVIHERRHLAAGLFRISRHPRRK